MKNDKPVPPENPPPENPQPPPQQQQRRRRFPGLVRPRQSAISLRRLSTAAQDGSQANNANPTPQLYRSMLDVDDNADRGSIKLRRLGSTTRPSRPTPGPPSNPQNVRSMLDVDDNTDRNTQAADFAPNDGANEHAQVATRERLGRFGRMRVLGRRPRAGSGGQDQLIVQDEYDPSIVDMLDVVGKYIENTSPRTSAPGSPINII